MLPTRAGKLPVSWARAHMASAVAPTARKIAIRSPTFHGRQRIVVSIVDYGSDHCSKMIQNRHDQRADVYQSRALRLLERRRRPIALVRAWPGWPRAGTLAAYPPCNAQCKIQNAHSSRNQTLAPP